MFGYFLNISGLFSYISEPNGPARQAAAATRAHPCRRRKLPVQRRARLPRPLDASAGGPPQRPEWLPVTPAAA